MGVPTTEILFQSESVRSIVCVWVGVGVGVCVTLSFLPPNSRQEYCLINNFFVPGRCVSVHSC